MSPGVDSSTSPSRAARLEAAGCSITIHPEANRILGLDREILPKCIESVLQEHARLLLSPGRSVLKNAPESAVTLVVLPGRPRVCVKEFRWRGVLHSLKSLFRATQGSRTFRNGWRLLTSGIPAAAPLALVAQKLAGLVHTEWIVMEVVPNALELDRYMAKKIAEDWTGEQKREMAALLGKFVGSMHFKGIFHSDLKTCNILVNEDRSLSESPVEAAAGATSCRAPHEGFMLLDYDDVRFGTGTSDRKRIKNLVQIFLSTPMAVGLRERLVFLRHYASAAGLDGREKRRLALDVLQAARGRDILYVAFNGDVIEKWE